MEELGVDARIALKEILAVRWTGLDWIYLAFGNMVLKPLVPYKVGFFDISDV